MRKRYITFTILVALSAILFWLLHTPHENLATQDVVEENIDTPIGLDGNSATETLRSPSNPLPPSLSSTDEEMEAWGRQEMERRQRDRERVLDEWRTPIEFYGKVVDENDEPVAQAQVNFSCNDLSAEGTSYYQTVSDSQGLFSIDGIQGKLLTVRVSKTGYYTSKRDNDSFYYAGQNQNFVPSATRPVLFHLKKHGVKENLLTASGRLKIPLDGNPRVLDIETGRAGIVGQSSITIECVSDYMNKTHQGHFDWFFRISVTNGGIIESEDEFDFIAPEEGYQPIYEVRMNQDVPDWNTMIDRKFFVGLPNGRYAKLLISFIAYNGVLRFQSIETRQGAGTLNSIQISNHSVLFLSETKWRCSQQ